MQVMEHTSEGIHTSFESKDRRHQKSKTGVPVAPQKGLISCKKFLFKYCDKNSSLITWMVKVQFSPARKPKYFDNIAVSSRRELSN